MNEILNPYIAGAPVVETSMFFGREDVFNWIEHSLAGKYVGHILVLHGQRRVGKTSVLKQISNHLPERYIQVFFDFQGRTNTSLERFLWWMAREIARTLKQERDITLLRPEWEDFNADPEYLINEFLPKLQTELGDHVLLLTFDEFDSIDRADIQETFSKPLIAYLRRLMEMEGLNFIFSIGSSGDKLENMQASYTDFFKSALYRKISFLTHDDCLHLITKPVEGVINYDRKAVERIVEITSGHPYFTQLMCHELFSLCQKTGEREISAAQVESILGDVIERGTVNLKFVWDEASNLEKWILAGLAQLEGSTPTQKLSQLLQKQHLRFSDSDLNSAIIHLRDKDVLNQENQFVIHLMRLWLQANRSIDRVREELVEANPIANRYIEIGDEYRETGKAAQAIESYQQALKADPGNLKAQSNIGTVHLEGQDFAEAVSAFELALRIAEEDLVSRSGYCDANLALGDQSRAGGQIDAAIGFYQKILVINPAHSDARQRLAELFSSRAEDLLVARQDNAALSAFNQAMEFTPEDDRLAARVEQVMSQKKARLVGEWLGKADRSAARQRWDEAAGFVEEALKLDPQDAALQAKLSEVKDAPRQFKIEGYKREAEQAIKRGNFEKAIAAIETALLLNPGDQLLVDWRSTVSSDQLNAQLNLYREQTRKAIAAGEWDSAIAACKEALKLAPDNTALKKELADTEKAKLQAQLAALQSQADQAVQSGEWDAAIQAIREAAKITPDKAPWDTKLAAIEVARHQAWLETCRKEAQAARAAGDWDAAILALQQSLKLDPSQADLQVEIETLRVEKHRSQLAGFKTQAGQATKIEKWDEAVKCWEAVLSLDPESQKEIAAPLEYARKYAKISGAYAEAQLDLRRKRYGRAIELLQGIIAQDPTYKSTSRLLVEAVEANKATPAWRRPAVFWAAGAVGVILLGIFLGPRLWTTISVALARTPVAGEPQSTLPAVTASPPFIYSIESIQAYIAGNAPDFADDFSANNGYWGDQLADGVPIADKIKDGVLNLALESGTPSGKLALGSSSMQAANFVLEFDFYYEDSTVGTYTSVNIGFPSTGDGSGTNCDIWINFEDPSWVINLSDISINERGNINTPLKGQWAHLQVVYFGTRVVAFLNGDLLGQVDGIAKSGDQIWIVATTQRGQAKVRLDNVKFWDLDGLETGAGPIPTPTPPPTQTAAGPAFYEPVQSYLASVKPTFEDDFSAQNAAWGGTSKGMAIYAMLNEGRLFLNTDNAKSSTPGDAPYLTFPVNGLFDGGNFALQFDFEFNGPDRVGVEFRALSSQEPEYRMTFSPDDSWELTQNNGKVVISNGMSSHTSGSNTVRLIVQDQNLAIFLDEQLLYEASNLALPGTSNRIYAEGSSGTRGIFDNFKFWNLDGVQISAGPTPTPTPTAAGSAFYEPILAYLAEGHITFQDDMTIPGNCIYAYNICMYDNGGVWSPLQYGSIWLENGYRLIKKNEPNVAMTFPALGEFNATDFAIQWDLSFDTSTPLDGFGLYFRAPSNLETYYQILFKYSNGGWTLSRDDGTIKELGSGSAAFVPRDFNTFLVITRQENLAIFVNKELIIERNDLAKSGIYNLLVATARESGRSAKLDNFIFWNLNGVDFK